MKKIPRSVKEYPKKVFAEINKQPWYDQCGFCDDCLFYGDNTKKLVKRIEDDGIYFCIKHWEDHKTNMAEGGYTVEPFLPQ